MQGLPLQCKNLQEQVESILQLIQQEPFFRFYNVTSIQTSGNLTIDTPGIDTPVEKDSHFTYARIECSDTSSVICVFKPASASDMTKEETELLETIRENPGIRDRVFYVFNRIDETWYNSQLRQRLDDLMPMADKQADEILQQYPKARTYLEPSLEREAEEKILSNRHLLNVVGQKIATYNSAVTAINECIQAVQLYDCLLPTIEQLQSEKVDMNFSKNGLLGPNGAVKSIKL